MTAELLIRDAIPQPGWQYVSVHASIPIICTICGKHSKPGKGPRLSGIMSGQRACNYCADEVRASRKRLDPSNVKRRLIEDAHWLPDEPFNYVNNATHIPGTCMDCGTWGEGPRWNDVKDGKQGACGRCHYQKVGDALRLPQSESWNRCLTNHWRPRDGHIFRTRHDRVPGHCMRCGRPGRAVFGNLGKKNVCRYCAVKHRGFKTNQPARLYIVTHDQMQAVKVGVTNLKGRRLENYKQQGWEIVAVRHYALGADALFEEQRIIDLWRDNAYPQWLTRELMPNSGETETAHIDALALYLEDRHVA